MPIPQFAERRMASFDRSCCPCSLFLDVLRWVVWQPCCDAFSFIWSNRRRILSRSQKATSDYPDFVSQKTHAEKRATSDHADAVSRKSQAEKATTDHSDAVSRNTQEAGGSVIRYTTRLRPQSNLVLLGVGASGQVYQVDEHVVLKTSRIFEPPPNDAPPQDRYLYASDTFYHFNLMQDERAVSRLLEQRPHPNIVQFIDTDHPEGIYLRRYRPLSQVEPMPVQSVRIQWYRDILSALLHLHSLGIAHSDVRVDNIVFNYDTTTSDVHVYLCDFSTSCPFGEPNPAFPHPYDPVPVNGLAETVSEVTDLFAMGSLIYRMEHGGKPKFSIDDRGALVLPEVQTGHDGLDAVICRAWLGQYSSTAEMLKHVESFLNGQSRSAGRSDSDQITREPLRDRVRQWREQRKKQFGALISGVATFV